jgi:hypothetical protein
MLASLAGPRGALDTDRPVGRWRCACALRSRGRGALLRRIGSSGGATLRSLAAPARAPATLRAAPDETSRPASLRRRSLRRRTTRTSPRTRLEENRGRARFAWGERRERREERKERGERRERREKRERKEREKRGKREGKEREKRERVGGETIGIDSAGERGDAEARWAALGSSLAGSFRRAVDLPNGKG